MLPLRPQFHAPSDSYPRPPYQNVSVLQTLDKVLKMFVPKPQKVQFQGLKWEGRGEGATFGRNISKFERKQL